MERRHWSFIIVFVVLSAAVQHALAEDVDEKDREDETDDGPRQSVTAETVISEVPSSTTDPKVLEALTMLAEEVRRLKVESVRQNATIYYLSNEVVRLKSDEERLKSELQAQNAAIQYLAQVKSASPQHVTDFYVIPDPNITVSPPAAPQAAPEGESLVIKVLKLLGIR